MQGEKWTTRIFSCDCSIYCRRWKKTVTALAIIATLIGAIFARALAFYQRKRLTNEEEAHRETHNLSLFRALASSNPRLQLAAAAVLVERLKRLGKERQLSDFQQSEKVAIIRALVSVTKSSIAVSDQLQTESEASSHSVGIGKFVADSVAEILDEEATVREKRSKLRRTKSPMLPYDWQSVRLHYAWWVGIDAREVDFFGADLRHSGMKLAHFHKAQLREAILCKTILKGADLSEANLTGANLAGANLDEANLCGSVLTGVKNFSTASFVNAKYDKKTIFPDDLDWATKLAQMISTSSPSTS